MGPCYIKKTSGGVTTRAEFKTQIPGFLPQKRELDEIISPQAGNPSLFQNQVFFQPHFLSIHIRQRIGDSVHVTSRLIPACFVHQPDLTCRDEGTASSRNNKYILGGVVSSIWARAADLSPDQTGYPRSLPDLTMTSLLPFLTTNYLSAIYDPESRHHSLRKMNSNFTTPFTAIDQIFKSNSYLWHNLSAFSLLQVHSYFNKMTRGPSVFQLRQIMPCCYEVPPTLWRPNSFFRVR